jgi:hypothetical protein
MRLALDIARMKKTPADSGVWVLGRNVRKVLFSVDDSASELMPAREHGMEAASSCARVVNVSVNLD